MDYSSKALTSAELAILGLVIERDMHGYEIEAVIQERGMRNWTEIGFSSIYHVLGLLEKGGSVSSRVEVAPGRGPARKVFSATAEGRARYAKEALAALASDSRRYSPFVQGLAALPCLPPAAAADAVAEYRAGLESRLVEVEARSRGELPFHVEAMFSYSRAMIKAEAEWASNFERALRERAGKGADR
jgi:Predicted transcriptional regulators